MTISHAGARALSLPVPSHPRVVPDPLCVCEHRRSGHHVTRGGAVTYCCNGKGPGQCRCRRFEPAPPITVDEFAQDLVPWAARLVGIVHDAGGPMEVDELLRRVAGLHRPDEVDPLVALAVVLAALVPAEVVPAEALSWITWAWSGAAS